MNAEKSNETPAPNISIDVLAAATHDDSCECERCGRIWGPLLDKLADVLEGKSLDELREMMR